MIALSVFLLLIASALGFTIGVKYMLAKEFFPYHAQVAGAAWPSIDRNVQTIIRGMLKVIGGGFVTLAVTLAWLSFAVWKRVAWAPWATLTIAALGIGPALYVAVHLRSIRPGAKTPIAPLLIGLVLIVFAAGLALSA